MTPRHPYRILAVSAAFSLWLPLAALADADSDRAFEAVKNGEIAPLSSILAQVREMYGGRVLEVELEEEPLNKPENYAPDTADDEEDIAKQELMGAPTEAAKPLERFLPAGEGAPPVLTKPDPQEEAEERADPRFQPLPRFVDDPNAPVMYYEIKLLTDDGYVLKLKFDARSSDLLSVDGHNKKKRKHDGEDDEPSLWERFMHWGN